MDSLISIEKINKRRFVPLNHIISVFQLLAVSFFSKMNKQDSEKG